jgi:inner membrane protein
MVGFLSVYAAALVFSGDSYNTQTIVVAILFTSLGSLTPDLDSQENVLYSLVPIGHRAVSEVFERLFGRHRSISHSLIGITIFSFLSAFLIGAIPKENGLDANALYAAYMISLIAHVAADAITKDGVPLLWPLKFKFGFPPFAFLRFKTGGWYETYVIRSLVIVSILFLTFIYWDRVLQLHK